MSLFTLDDIAARVGVPRSYARDDLVKRPGFPKPVLRLSQRIVKWAESDIDNWLKAEAKKLAR